MIKQFVVLLFAVVICDLTVLAAIDAYEFTDVEMEARYQRLIDELRCPQCLNTNLAGSDAPIAQDLRREVHVQLLQGKSDEQILVFMRERYGDFILYRPRVTATTLILWLGPLLVLVAGVFWVYRIVSSSRAETEKGSLISDEDEQKLTQLLSDSDK